MRGEERLDDTFLDHYGYPQTYGGAILMVILHNEAHRTEVLHIFARLGVPELAQVEVDHGLAVRITGYLRPRVVRATPLLADLARAAAAAGAMESA